MFSLLTCFPAYQWVWSVHINTGRYAFRIIFKHVDQTIIQEKALRYYMSSGIIEPDQNRVLDHINVYDCAAGVRFNAKSYEKLIRKNKEWPEIVGMVMLVGSTAIGSFLVFSLVRRRCFGPS